MNASPHGDDAATRGGNSSVPAVSVLMPVFNGGAFLEPAIRSVLQQSFANFEFIIVDDGSTDGSGAVIARHAAADRRIRAVHQANQGYTRALSAALEQSTAPLIARMDADDLCMPRRFALQVAAFQQRPELAALGGHTQAIDVHGRVLGTWLSPVGARAVRRVAREHSPLPHPAAMMRRTAVDAVGGYRWEIEPAEDYDLWLRMLDAGFIVDNLPLVILAYRQHSGSVSATRASRQRVCTLMARTASRMRRAGLPDPVHALRPVDQASFEQLPAAFRPCPSQLWEALHGAVHAASPAAVLHGVEHVRNSGESPACQRPSAAFFLRAAVRLLTQRQPAEGLRALRLAVSADPLVLARQGGTTSARRARRWAERLHYLATRSRG